MARTRGSIDSGTVQNSKSDPLYSFVIAYFTIYSLLVTAINPLILVPSKGSPHSSLLFRGQLNGQFWLVGWIGSLLELDFGILFRANGSWWCDSVTRVGFIICKCTIDMEKRWFWSLLVLLLSLQTPSLPHGPPKRGLFPEFNDHLLPQN